MRIQNLKAPHETVTTKAAIGTSDAVDPVVTAPSAEHNSDAGTATERASLEIAFLKARIQHLELVLETARGLMGSNHERLLRRLYETPRELVELGAQLRRIDQQVTW